MPNNSDNVYIVDNASHADPNAAYEEEDGNDHERTKIKLSEMYLSAIELRKRKRKEVTSIDARDSLTLSNVKRPAAVGIGRNSAVGSKRARK